MNPEEQLEFISSMDSETRTVFRKLQDTLEPQEIAILSPEETRLILNLILLTEAKRRQFDNYLQSALRQYD